MDFQTDFEPLDKVCIDGDEHLIGLVTSFQFRPTSDGGYNETVEVSYVHNGDCKSAWIERNRLKKWPR
jgi:hypothetical protein